MNRRDFLKLSSVSATVLAVDLALPEKAFAAQKKYNVLTSGFSILQGLTTQTSTQLSIDVPYKMKVSYELVHIDSGEAFEPHYLKTVTRGNDWRVDKLAYLNLPYLGKFIFRVRDEKKKVIDERNLGLLDLDKKNPRFALMSCMLDSNANKDQMWSNVEKADCDILFFLGDNAYGDLMAVFNGPNLLWNRYIETRQSLPYYHWKNLKPALCTWDDHDYGLNNQGGGYRHKHESLKTFKAFTAQDAIVDCFENGPGVSSFFKAFGQKFLLLDNRFFKGLSHSNIKGFLGKEQFEWAFSKLSSGFEPNWVMEGSQFFQGERKGNECYIMDAPEECEMFRREIAKLNSPCVFAAGDVHFTEVSRLKKDLLGYETVEITSSSLHSFTTAKLPENLDRLEGAEKENFMVIDIIPTVFDLQFEFTSIGMSKVNFKDTFGV